MVSSDLINALRHFDASQGPRKLGPEEGPYTQLPGVGVRFMIWGEESGGGFSMVEHPIPPNTLCAPYHRHSREDEYSFVLQGRMGALLGDDVVYAEEGELAFKPKDQWHTFWNAGDEPCRILEIIAPAGFEHFFAEFGNFLEMNPETEPPMAEYSQKYGIDFDMEATERIVAEHGLSFPPLEAMKAARA
jgi:mannose-6-phosphate isomerase-like protein (cupin superfamily)